MSDAALLPGVVRLFGFTTIAAVLAGAGLLASPLLRASADEPVRAQRDAGDRPPYPVAVSVDIIEDYHGVAVADPYRWLEDPTSPDTRSFIDQQNELTRGYVETEHWPVIRSRLEQLIDYPRVGTPDREGGKLFYSINSGLQNHNVLFTAPDGSGPEAGIPLLDPNAWSEDGTTALAFTRISRDGRLMAYGISEGGSDDRIVRILDLPRAIELARVGRDIGEAHFPETLKNMRFAGTAWHPEGAGFWYNQYPMPGTVSPEEERFNNRVFWHKLGSDQNEDVLVWEHPDDPELSWWPWVTPNQRYLILYTSRGTDRRSGLYVREIAGDPLDDEFTKLFPPQEAVYSVVDDPADGKLVLLTDHDAPRRKLVRISIDDPSHDNWETLIPEPESPGEVLQSVHRAGDRYVALYLRNAQSRLVHVDLDGNDLREVELPTVGTVRGITADPDSHDFFFSFSGYTYPSTPFRYDLRAGELEQFADNTPAGFDPEQYETKQVFYESGDGTRVPMFITHRKGLELDGSNPTLLHGYGGFNVSQTPGFSSLRLAWLEQGGIYAVANLRGGGEFGREWHEAGKFANRQNVFDDFHAAAEFLISEGYTRTDKLAISGGSNGGLLVAAAMTQRPDLYGAVICSVPVIDMLRYHLWGTGRFWTVEYGNAIDNPEHFEFLYAYSPLHNAGANVDYPPLLVLTGDGDDRVVPAHALKYIATLQATSPDAWPMLLRYDVGSGHGAGKPMSKVLDEQADIYAFLARALDIDWQSK